MPLNENALAYEEIEVDDAASIKLAETATRRPASIRAVKIQPRGGLAFYREDPGADIPDAEEADWLGHALPENSVAYFNETDAANLVFIAEESGEIVLAVTWYG